MEAFGKLSIQPQDIFTGYSRFTVKTHEDRIYSIGNNYNGGCGCGEDQQIEKYTEILMDNILRNKVTSDLKKPNNFVSCVSSGTNHMLFVLNDILYATGQNEYGQCGNGKAEGVIKTPELITRKFNGDENKIVKIECGYNHSILLSKIGKIYALGSNEEHQCGIEWVDLISPDVSPAVSPKSMDSSGYGGGFGFSYGFNQKKKTRKFKTIQEIPCGVHFRDISVGGYHNLCISTEPSGSKLYIFGKNKTHELGVYKEAQDYYETPTLHPYFGHNKSISFTSTKHEHSLAIDKDGFCYLFGANNAHQISKKRSEYINDVVIFQKEYHEFRKVRIQSGSCGYNHTVLLARGNHHVIGFGGNDYRQTNPLNQNKITKDPHTFNNMEIGIKFEQRIVRVIAGEFTTVLVQQ